MRAIALLLCLLSTQAWAVDCSNDCFMRPAADCANNGDGTAYECAASGGAVGAWRTAANVVWGASGVDTGHTLRACSSESSPFTTADYDGGGLAVLSVDQAGAKVNGDCSASGGGTMAYFEGNGSRDYGVYCATNAHCSGQDWRNMTVNGTDVRGFYVRNDLSTSGVHNAVLENLTATDIAGAAGNGPHGFSVFGSGATLTNVRAERTTDDCFSIQGPNTTLSNWICIYPGYLQTGDHGDCVQVVNAADNSKVRLGYCDKRNNATKQCVIFGDPATGSSGEITDNVCMMAETGGATNSTKALYSVVPSTRFERNFIYGSYYGIYMLGAGSSAVGNVLVGQELRGIDAVSTVTSGTHLIANNSVYNSNSCFVFSGGASVTINAYNNLAMGCATAGYTKGGSATLNQTNNAAYSNTANTSGSVGSIAVTSDPLLVGGSSPNDAAGFCLEPDSPLLAAGTYIGAWATGYNGHDLGNPPAIGARGLCNPRIPAAARESAAR